MIDSAFDTIERQMTVKLDRKSKPFAKRFFLLSDFLNSSFVGFS